MELTDLSILWLCGGTVAGLKAGGVYDVAVIENSNIAALTTLGLRREINYQNISNFRNSAPDIFNTSIFFAFGDDQGIGLVPSVKSGW